MLGRTRTVATLALLALAICPMLAGCDGITDHQRLVGRWEGSLDSIEFFSNSDFRIYALLITHTGKWELPGDGRIKYSTEGILGHNGEFKYELDGDKLTLKNMAAPTVFLVYQRKR